MKFRVLKYRIMIKANIRMIIIVLKNNNLLRMKKILNKLIMISKIYKKNQLKKFNRKMSKILVSNKIMDFIMKHYNNHWIKIHLNKKNKFNKIIHWNNLMIILLLKKNKKNNLILKKMIFNKKLIKK